MSQPKDNDGSKRHQQSEEAFGPRSILLRMHDDVHDQRLHMTRDSSLFAKLKEPEVLDLDTTHLYANMLGTQTLQRQLPQTN